MDALQILIGLVVNQVEELNDYIQFVFSDGTTLSIFNNYVYDGGSVKSIEGKKVKSVKESGKAVVIVFDGEESLSISLIDDDYNGPEAMVLKQEGKSTVVWN